MTQKNIRPLSVSVIGWQNQSDEGREETSPLRLGRAAKV